MIYSVFKVIEKMPETDQVPQFIDILEPFYNVAYKSKEDAPPIFNIFHAKHGKEQVQKMNGHLKNSESHVTTTSEENGMVASDRLNTSKASLLHNIEITNSPENGLNIIENKNLNSKEIEETRGNIPGLDIKKGWFCNGMMIVVVEFGLKC